VLDREQVHVGLWVMLLNLRNVQGYGWNHKRVYRIYCEQELNRNRPIDTAGYAA
jgi:putative transposase